MYLRKITSALALILLPLFAYGYDYSSLNSNLSESVKQSGTPLETLKIAIIFKVSEKDKVKTKFNLVDLKKDLANELVQYHQMTDPLVVAQILKINKLSYDDIENEKILLSKVGKKSEASHIALAHFMLQQDELLLDFQLMDLEGEKLAHIQFYVAPQATNYNEPSEEVDTPGSEPNPQIQSDSSVSGQKTSRSYTPPQLNDQFNDSWIYFSPTAFLNPKISFFEISLWPKDLQNTEILVVQSRYDFTIKRYFTIGTIAHGDEEGEYHSQYAYAKIKLFQAPVASLAIGLKRRLAWNSRNTEFESDDEAVDDRNFNRNELTLQAMASGLYQDLGVLWNVYLDNQTIGLGGIVLLTSEIKMLVDSIFYYYENAENSGDQSVGFQFNDPSGATSTLSYQSTNEQIRFSVGFSW